jgi:hypothetical protein
MTSAGSRDAFLARYTPAGAIAFARSMGGGAGDNANGLAIDPATGDAVVTGTFNGKAYFNPGFSAFRLTTADNKTDAFVARFSNAGLFRDAARIGTAGVDDFGPHASIGGGGEIYLCGNFRGSIDLDPGPAVKLMDNPHADNDAYLVKATYKA